MNNIPFDWPKTFQEFNLQKATILLVLGGSRAYGTNLENSDWDYRGICIPPLSYRNRLFKNFEQTIWKSEELSGRESETVKDKEKLYEATVFSLEKFFKLATECNPNIIEILFSGDNLVVFHNEKISNLLRNNKHLFLSNRALYSFTGYAISQLKRIETHKKYLDNIEKWDKVPTRSDFGLLETEKSLNESELQAVINFVSNSLEEISPWLVNATNETKEKFFYSVAALLATLMDNKGFKFDPNLNNWIEIQEDISNELSETLGFETSFTDYLKKEKAYFRAKREYKQFLNWKENRNKDRAELEAAYGFDGKHGLHLMRLLMQCEELLTTGTFNVRQPEEKAKFLKDIRNGSMTFNELLEIGKQKEYNLYQLVKEKKTILPDKPDLNKIENLYLEIININDKEN